MSEETEALSCDPEEYRRQLCSVEGRVAVTFVGKEFPGTESYLEALAQADEGGFLGQMRLGVQTVDSEECNALAEAEGVETLPRTIVYECKEGQLTRVGEINPTDEDAKASYRPTIEQLIELSED